MDQTLQIEPGYAHKVDPDFRREVLRGLSASPKSLPCRFLYDARGSELFEEITRLTEYYPTRTEIGLLSRYGLDIGADIPPGAVVVEFGSGSGRKTGLLLAAMNRPKAYVPIEISASALYPAARRIKRDFPEILVHPILGEFQDLRSLDLPFVDAVKVGFFPGSTIGNFTWEEAASFLTGARELLGPDAIFVIGVDLKKPLDILLPAYNDETGVTAAFNLNLLSRINRELGGDFEIGAFTHEAVYNDGDGRIEMYLRSQRNQKAAVGGHVFAFRKGEAIHTENSHKYSALEFSALAERSGWTVKKTYIDDEQLFSIDVLV